MHLRTFAAVMTALLITAAAVGAPIEYPKTKKVDQVDDYHGTKVADPYRWLEDDVRTSKDVADWVEAENKVTFAYLGASPSASRSASGSPTLWNYEKYSRPVQARRPLLLLEEQRPAEPVRPLHGRQARRRAARPARSQHAGRRTAPSPSAASSISDDGKYARLRRRRGRVGLADVDRCSTSATGKQLADELKWVKFSGIAWTKDGKGFFYSRFPSRKRARSSRA